jgi:hypothetical protein
MYVTMTIPLAFAVAIVCAAFLTGCGSGQRPVAKVAEDIRRVAPIGWTVVTSNTAIRIQSERDVTLIGRFSRPFFKPMGMEQLARDFGNVTKYQVTLSLVPRLTNADLERLCVARRPFGQILDKGARSKDEYDNAQRGFDLHPAPTFYTDDYSVFVERPSERLFEVYPSESAAEIDMLMTSLKRVFREY